MNLPKGMRHIQNRCSECDANQITIATQDLKSRVGWCENGHVVVCDPNLMRRFKLVYDFHLEN